jgi:hypothetical protein
MVAFPTMLVYEVLKKDIKKICSNEGVGSRESGEATSTMGTGIATKNMRILDNLTICIKEKVNEASSKEKQRVTCYVTCHLTSYNANLLLRGLVVLTGKFCFITSRTVYKNAFEAL